MKRISLIGVVVCLSVCAASVMLGAATGTLTTLHTFTGVDGSAPEAGLALGTNGNFYGTTVGGGTSTNCLDGCGTVFEISSSGAFTSLHSFTNYDGSVLRGALVQASDGNLYGTTFAGGFFGPGGEGSVFRMTASGVVTMIHSSDIDFHCGVGPESVLLEGTDGNFYGTTYFTMYRVTTNGVCTELNVMLGGGKAGLVYGTNGNFYGTTQFGGTSTNCTYGCGSVFMITPAGVLTRLHSFDRSDGQEPLGELVLGSDGNFYGTTSGSPLGALNCANGCGTVFMITPDGVFTNLHTFAGPEGRLPYAGLVEGADHNFYGTTFRGGGVFNAGTVFQITTNGVYTKLLSFTATNGGNPAAPLILGPDGSFYGTTEVDGSGTNALGTVFKLTVSTNASSGALSCDLLPALATNTVGDTHTVVATVTSNGVPRVGLAVHFLVTSGPNVNTTATGNTAANGQIAFMYSGTVGPGTDIIRATGGVGVNAFTSTATKVWIAAVAPDLSAAMVLNSITCSNEPKQVVCELDGDLSLLNNGAAFAAGHLLLTSTCKPAVPVPKCKLAGTLTLTQVNPPNIAAPSLGIYLSDDMLFDTGDALMGQMSLSKWPKAFATGKPIKVKAKIPAGINASGKYLLFVIDNTNVVSESDETNNSVSFGPLP